MLSVRATFHTVRMRRILAAAVIAASLALAGCSAPPVREPVTVTVSELQGETVRVAVDQIIYLNVEARDVDGFEAEIQDRSIVEFEPGADMQDVLYFPGFTPLQVGRTEVTLTNDDLGIEPVTFTVDVVEAQG
jgi:hypothetical protein